MSDYSFSEDKKVAIWRADGEKCFYCRVPVPYSELQIDHIVPEKVPAETLAELQPLLPTGFKINSIPNWVACHQGCNIRKNAYVFETPTTLYYVGMAARRASAVQRNIDDFQVQKDNGRLLSTLKVRLEKGHLAQAAVLAVLGLCADGLRSVGHCFRCKLPRRATDRCSGRRPSPIRLAA